MVTNYSLCQIGKFLLVPITVNNKEISQAGNDAPGRDVEQEGKHVGEHWDSTPKPARTKHERDDVDH